MRLRHAWTAGSLAATALVVLLVTRHAGVAVEVVGNLWPWVALLLWIILVPAGAGVAWWAWRHVLAGLVTLGLLGGLAVWALQPTAPRLGFILGQQAWFEHHRADFTRAAADLPEDCCNAYYGDRLPDGLRHLTIDGRVSRHEGDLFFPQWIALVDDAGGYWYSPDGSPEGHDMYGMICEDPTDLGDGWWSCGM
ncbi:MAG TPA: hypothetical protein VM575_07100 [Nocardioides sp.]|nr:hypothetical protein [Nocardioides sp.]